MSCNNCHSQACKVSAAEYAEGVAWKHLSDVGGREASATYQFSSEALATAQSDCANRAACRYNADTLARLAAIEARQDRIEAMLIAKGCEL